MDTGTSIFIVASAALVIGFVIVTALRETTKRTARGTDLFQQFVTATGLERDEDTFDMTTTTLLRSEWTPDDITRLGRTIDTNLQAQGKTLTRDVRRVSASHADTMFAAIWNGALPNTRPAQQEPWIALRAAWVSTPIADPLGPYNASVDHIEKTVHRWHKALGDLAPHALAAGLTLDEATAAQAARTLDPETLFTLSALRGVILPRPAHLDTRRQPPA